MLMHRRTPSLRLPSTARGISLIEVLVAMVIISVGLLGIAALQLTSLRGAQTAALRTQATALADDIIDRMRANRTAALAGSYDIALGTAAPTGSTRAEEDLSEWKSALVTTLPGTDSTATADGSVDMDATTNIVTVTIQWAERPNSPSSSTADTSTPFMLSFVTRTEI